MLNQSPSDLWSCYKVLMQSYCHGNFLLLILIIVLISLLLLVRTNNNKNKKSIINPPHNTVHETFNQPRNNHSLTLTQAYIDHIVSAALQEDIGPQDITTFFLVSSKQRGQAKLIAKEEGILAGLDVFKRCFTSLDHTTKFINYHKDGDPVSPGRLICEIEGNLATILKAERVALNLLQRISGIASYTNKYVRAIANTSAQIYDTRKTTPGLRWLEKYAVYVGEGCNHRFGLYDHILIKENHLKCFKGDFSAALAKIRRSVRVGVKIEVEVDTMDKLPTVLSANPDIIMFDNMTPEQVAEGVIVVRNYNPKIEIEASGNLNLTTVRAYADTGVDRLAIGSITHSAPALDLSLLIV